MGSDVIFAIREESSGVRYLTDSYPRTRSSRWLPIARSYRLAGFPRFTFSQHNIHHNRCGSINPSPAMEKHWDAASTERLVRFHLDFMNPILQLNPRLFGLGMSRVRPRNMVNSGNLAPCKDRASLRDEVSAAHNLQTPWRALDKGCSEDPPPESDLPTTILQQKLPRAAPSRCRRTSDDRAGGAVHTQACPVWAI